MTSNWTNDEQLLPKSRGKKERAKPQLTDRRVGALSVSVRIWGGHLVLVPVAWTLWSWPAAKFVLLPLANLSNFCPIVNCSNLHYS